MAKKRKGSESTDNKKRKRSESTDNKKKQSSQNSKSKKTCSDNKKLSDFSYAELIVLSATLSYSLAEEFDQDDLAIFLVFLGLLIAEIQAIVTQRAIRDKSQVVPTEDLELEDININLNQL